MDLEIQRVARELYKAFSGLNEEFERPQDQVDFCTMYMSVWLVWIGFGGLLSMTITNYIRWLSTRWALTQTTTDKSWSILTKLCKCEEEISNSMKYSLCLGHLLCSLLLWRWLLFRYGRDLNSVLKDNLGDNWDEVCSVPQYLSFCVHTKHLLKITSIPTYIRYI